MQIIAVQFMAGVDLLTHQTPKKTTVLMEVSIIGEDRKKLEGCALLMQHKNVYFSPLPYDNKVISIRVTAWHF